MPLWYGKSFLFCEHGLIRSTFPGKCVSFMFVIASDAEIWRSCQNGTHFLGERLLFCISGISVLTGPDNCT